MDKFFKNLKKDICSCAKGAGESLVSSPFGTSITLVSLSPAGIVTTAADVGISCGKKIAQRRKLEKRACRSLRVRDYEEVDRIGVVYKHEKHGSVRDMLSSC